MKENICQSCGMPLYHPEEYGTDQSGLHIEDYCQYCFKDGAFTSDVTMDEMIELCAQYVNGNSKEKAVINMKKQFPTLKRWAQKENTQKEYYRSINKVLNYIQQHLDEKPDMNRLAKIANTSPFHFQRIFKATIGETLGEYVLRLRMEYIAEQLKISTTRLSELAIQTGYSSEQALSRAFKKHFTIPPSAFRISFYNENNLNETIPSPRICRMSSKKIIKLSEDKIKDNLPLNQEWKKLYMYAILNGLIDDTAESLEIIKNSNNTGENLIMTPVLTCKEEEKKAVGICYNVIEKGLYAIFTYQGTYEKIEYLYKKIINNWLPKSKYKVRKNSHYVKYLNRILDTKNEKNFCEIYIPIKEI